MPSLSTVTLTPYSKSPATWSPLTPSSFIGISVPGSVRFLRKTPPKPPTSVSTPTLNTTGTAPLPASSANGTEVGACGATAAPPSTLCANEKVEKNFFWLFRLFLLFLLLRLFLLLSLLSLFLLFALFWLLALFLLFWLFWLFRLFLRSFSNAIATSSAAFGDSAPPGISTSMKVSPSSVTPAPLETKYLSRLIDEITTRNGDRIGVAEILVIVAVVLKLWGYCETS